MQWQNVFRFVLAALATWRLAFLIAREDGPWHVTARLRQNAGNGFFGELLNCLKCVGVWIAAPFALFVGGRLVDMVVVWLAIAGVVALIDEVTRPPFEWQSEKVDELLRTDANNRDD